MVFLVNPIDHRFCCFLIFFMANQMGSERLFDNLTIKHMDALRKQIQSLVDSVLSQCFWTYAMLSKF